MVEIDMRFSPRVAIDSVEGIGARLISWGERVLMVADAIWGDAARAVRDRLDSRGVETIIFTREEAWDDTATLDELLSLARGSRAQIVIGLGGESILSLARLTAAAAPTDKSAYSIWEGGSVGTAGLPLLEIPGRGRHALLFLNSARLVDTATRQATLVEFSAPPRHEVLIDPSPDSQRGVSDTVVSAAALLAASTEAFLSQRSSFISDTAARSAIRNAVSLLRRVRDESANPVFRNHQAETVVLSAFATGLTGTPPAMMLSWCAAAAGGAAKKAEAYAVILPWALESPLYAGSPRFPELSRLIAAPGEEDVAHPPSEVRALFGELELPGRLRDMGADPNGMLFAPRWASEIMAAERPDLNESTLRSILQDAS